MSDKTDDELVQIARDFMSLRFKKGRHHVAAALRVTSGQIFTGVHLEANVGRIAVCAEAVAIGIAAAAGDTSIQTIVAVNREGEVVPPCGMCRELISDYSPNANVIIKRNGEIVKVAVADLLPYKYVR